MNVVTAEFRKLVGLAAVRWTWLAGGLIPVALSAWNGVHIRRVLAQGRPGVTPGDAAIIGVGELLLTIAAAAAIGALSVGSEYRNLPLEQGGGREATTTALATPQPARALMAKLVATLAVLATMAVIASAGGLLAAHHFLGDLAVPFTESRWMTSGRGMAYVVLTGLLAFAASALLRNGLVPLVYLVANSLVVSPGYLLTRVFPAAWYLPDTSGMALLQDVPDPHRPSVLVGGVTMTAWVTALLVAAVLVQRRRGA